MAGYNVQKLEKYGIFYGEERVDTTDYDVAKRVHSNGVARNGVYLVKKDGYWDILDFLDKRRLDIKCLSITDFIDGVAIISFHGENNEVVYKLIDDNLSIVTPNSYEYIEFTKLKLYIVRKNDKYGIIDKMGNEILPCEYDEVYEKLTSHGDKQYLALSKDDHDVLVDSEGKTFVIQNV